MARSRIFLAVALALGGVAAVAEPLPEAAGSQIGFPTVAAALQALRALPDFHISVENGWTLAVDSANTTFWAFPPASDPSYPSAVKREFVKMNGDLLIHMSVHCEASKAACDKLVIDFQHVNDALREHVNEALRERVNRAR